MQDILSQPLHNFLYSSICIVILLIIKRPLLKNGGHFCYFYLWLLPIFVLCNPVAFVVSVPWTSFDGAPLLSILTRYSILLFVVWLAGFCFSVGKIILSIIKTQRTMNGATEEPDENQAAIFDERKAALNIKANVNLRITDAAVSPMIVLARRPVVILPRMEISGSSLRLILDHELLHLKYGDIYIKALAYVVRAVYWWNPLTYILVNQMEEACELTCDYRVLQGKDLKTSLAYSQTVLSFAKNQLACHKTFGLAALSNNILVRRFELMLKPAQPIRRWFVLGIAFIMISCSFIEFRDEEYFSIPSEIIVDELNLVPRIDGLYDVFDPEGNLVFFGIEKSLLDTIMYAG